MNILYTKSPMNLCEIVVQNGFTFSFDVGLESQGGKTYANNMVKYLSINLFLFVWCPGFHELKYDILVRYAAAIE